MARAIGIGNQDFETIQKQGYFYIDKTRFIREWWDSGDSVTLITRPRRFGKTLNMSMLEQFFSVRYAGRSDLFEGLFVWQEEQYRNLQGTYPVISLSFANVKEPDYRRTRRSVNRVIEDIYNKNIFLLDSGLLTENEKDYFRSVTCDMEDTTATWALHKMSDFLSRYYGKKVIILLDEYDAPMQEAYVNGYWDEMAAFTRSLFNSTFKTNPYLERAVMTGITRVSIASFEALESVFSDLNNLRVITTTSDKYGDCFGFTEEEVFAVLDEYGLSGQKQEVKNWYDGFIFGSWSDIYNPWSIINFLAEKKVGLYWANTSSNSLVEKLVREGSPEIKMTLERLLRGEGFITVLDEQIVFNQLEQGDDALWSLLLASGYLKTVHYEFNTIRRRAEFELKLTNMEVSVMFERMVAGWFEKCRRVNNAFLKALMTDDVKGMNTYMNKVALQVFSYFDTGKNPSEEEPERFYHGFVLGMMVELADKYVITSNRESGFGRYDVMLEPREHGCGVKNSAKENDAIIMEFKVQGEEEKELSDTVKEALRQIEEKNYQANLVAKGIPVEKIRKYGMAFRGKKVLIGGGTGK